MPLYEYHCSKCGKNFEVIQKFADAPLTHHEDCGGTVEKRMSAPSFHLKGSGWYVTEYGKGGKVPAGASSEGKAGENKSKDGQSSETKSNETKSDSGKSNDGKSSDTKSHDSKSSDSKPDSSGQTERKSKSETESKPAAAPAKSD